MRYKSCNKKIMDILIKRNENKEILIKDDSLINFSLEENSNLLLKFVSFNKFKNIEIVGKIKKNASLKCVFADFSTGAGKVKANISLVDEGASATWDLASLSSRDDNKEFDISFIHEKKNTTANMNNYGVSLGASRLVFSGINHIKKGAKKSSTNQNAKIIVFDKESKGKANPILKIDENDVMASHGAIVGRVNDEHLFYLKSRGLTAKEAKALIVYGYLKPIASYYDSRVKNRINRIIMERTHV